VVRKTWLRFPVRYNGDSRPKLISGRLLSRVWLAGRQVWPGAYAFQGSAAPAGSLRRAKSNNTTVREH